MSSGSFRSPKGTWGGAPRAPHPIRARPKVGPRPARVWGPHQAPGAHLSPISTPRRVNPNTKHHIPQKIPSQPSSSISDRGSSDVLSAPCQRGNHHRGLIRYLLELLLRCQLRAEYRMDAARTTHRLLMTHKYRGAIVVSSINKSVEPNEEQKVLTGSFDEGFTVNTKRQVCGGFDIADK